MSKLEVTYSYKKFGLLIEIPEDFLVFDKYSVIPAIENNLEINYVNISCCFREVLNVHINAHIVTIFYVTLIRVLLQNFSISYIWCAL